MKHRLAALAAATLTLAACGGHSSSRSPRSASANVPLAITEITKTLDWMHTTRKTGGLGYGIAQVQATHAYKALTALGGTWPAPPPPPPTTTTPTTTTTPSAAQANLMVATTGNDGCTRAPLSSVPLTADHTCRTLDRANAIAQGGDIVAVMGGDYPRDGSRIDTNLNSMGGDAILLINDVPRSSDATFVCGDDKPVTSPARYLLFLTQHLTMNGPCFHFRKVIMGDFVTGYFPSSKVCTNEQITGGASMRSFDILGPCNNITLSYSTVGPSVACYAPGRQGSCAANGAGEFGTPTFTDEQYFHDRGIGNDDCCTEPKVHHGGYNGAITPQNVTLGPGLQFYGFTSRDPDNGPHAGCLWLGYGVGLTGNVTVTGDSFDECMTYDIHIDSPSTPNLTITGNRFARPKDAIRALPDFNGIIDLPQGWVDVEVKCQDNEVLRNYRLTDNVFSANGYDLDYGGCSNASYPGLVINGNTLPLGARNNPPQPQP